MFANTWNVPILLFQRRLLIHEEFHHIDVWFSANWDIDLKFLLAENLTCPNEPNDCLTASFCGSDWQIKCYV